MLKIIHFSIIFIPLLIVTIQAIPWVAKPRFDTWWVLRHELYRETTASSADSINVLFYGDSITEGWEWSGREIFEQKYAPLGAANYGIWGDRTEHLLYRISDGETDKLRPKLIVLKIGTNNENDTIDDVAHGIRVVVDLLQEKMPTAKILLLGILPRNNATWFTRVSEINSKISNYDNGSTIRFLDMFDHFVTTTQGGILRKELYEPDQLHLVTAGYQVWATVMEDLFNEMFYNNNSTTF